MVAEPSSLYQISGHIPSPCSWARDLEIGKAQNHRQKPLPVTLCADLVVWHNALPLAWMVLAMVGTFFAVNNLWMTIVLLTLIASGTYASKGPFWALSSEWLGPTAAAAGLAQINALGNLSGFFFNYAIGWIKDETGSFPMALMPIAAVAAIGTICVLTMGRNQPRTIPVTA